MKLFRLSFPLRAFAFCAICLCIIAVSSCAHQPIHPASGQPGFFSGLFHGFFILFSFIGSLFSNIRIYACPNSGAWYDFGYLIGTSLFSLVYFLGTSLFFGVLFANED